MTYRIEFTRAARKALLAVSANERRRIERAIDALARTPRLRVLVLEVARRKDAYR